MMVSFLIRPSKWLKMLKDGIDAFMMFLITNRTRLVLLISEVKLFIYDSSLRNMS